MRSATARRVGWARAAFVVAALVNLVVLYWPRAVSQGDISFLDKFVHIMIFAVVAGTGRLARLPVAILVAVLIAHAVSSELVQHWFLANRSGDPLDVVADVVGVAAGVLVARGSVDDAGVAKRRSGGSLSP